MEIVSEIVALTLVVELSEDDDVGDADDVPVAEAVLEGDDVADRDGESDVVVDEEGDGVWLEETDIVAVSDRVAVSDGDWVIEGDVVPDPLGVLDEDGDNVALTVYVLVTLTVPEEVHDRVPDGDDVDVMVVDHVLDIDREHVRERVVEGLRVSVGLALIDGDGVDDALDDSVSVTEGESVVVRLHVGVNVWDELAEGVDDEVKVEEFVGLLVDVTVAVKLRLVEALAVNDVVCDVEEERDTETEPVELSD